MTEQDWKQRYATRFMQGGYSEVQAETYANQTYAARNDSFYSLLDGTPETLAAADLDCIDGDDIGDDEYYLAHDWLWNNGYKNVLESPEEHDPSELRAGIEAFKAAHSKAGVA